MASLLGRLCPAARSVCGVLVWPWPSVAAGAEGAAGRFGIGESALKDVFVGRNQPRHTAFWGCRRCLSFSKGFLFGVFTGVAEESGRFERSVA